MGKIITKMRQARLDYQQREGRVVSLNEVAAAIGVTPAALSKIERSQAWPGRGVLAELCKFYGVQPGELLEYEDRRATRIAGSQPITMRVALSEAPA